jgi:tetratricopeptide (TPR) repeat protein
MTVAVLFALLALADPPQQRPATPPPSFERISKQAAEARQHSDFAKAIGLYRNALKLRPNWTEGWWDLGTLLYDQDHYVEGRDAFRRVAALDPKNAKAFAMLGLCEYRTREYEPALGHLNRARTIGITAIEPQMLQVLMYHTGILLTRFEEYEAAMQMLLELVKQGNSGPAVIEAAGLAALRKPVLPPEVRPDDRELVFLAGRAVTSAAERNVVDAQKAFENLLTAYPKAPNVRYTYGAFLMLSDPDAGLREMLAELDVTPDHLPSLVAVALEYVKRGEPEKGRPYAERAVKTAPSSFTSHAAMGRVLVDVGKLPEGIRELEEARRLAPESPQVRIALASAYGRAGKTAEAARERAEFLKLKNASDPSFTPGSTASAKQP